MEVVSKVEIIDKKDLFFGCYKTFEKYIGLDIEKREITSGPSPELELFDLLKPINRLIRLTMNIHFKKEK